MVRFVLLFSSIDSGTFVLPVVKFGNFLSLIDRFFNTQGGTKKGN